MKFSTKLQTRWRVSLIFLQTYLYIYIWLTFPDFAVIYLCDIDEVPEFNTMYELYDPMTIMFFYRNKHMMCDFGTGNNNKLNWVLEDKQELVDIIETIYKGAKKGRGLVVSPKGKGVYYHTKTANNLANDFQDYSTRYRY